MNKIKLTIILTLFAALCGTANGQVTIGSGKEPMKGALLDIKEKDEPAGGVTASRGMMLPRVNLLNFKNLTGGPAGSPVIKDVADSEPDISRHIGLTVYHLGDCPGVYVWTGTNWIKLGESCAPAAPTGTNAFFCLSSTPGSEPATLTATVGTGETVDWYDNSGTKITTDITETTIGSATVSTFNPTVSTTAKTIYYAETRNITTGAVSATCTAVFATTYNDLSVIATKATPDETSAATNWGTNVVHHAAKKNPKYGQAGEPEYIYEEFASAWFGDPATGGAGRWMTTNLAAWAYDNGSASLPTASSVALDRSNPQWCYPKGGNSGGADATSYNNNPHLGLLYNWPAATGNQNGSTEPDRGYYSGK